MLLAHYGEKVLIGILKKNLHNIHITLCDVALEMNDKNERQRLLKLYHEDKIFGGHCGHKKLYAKLRANYFWKGMPIDAYRFVKNCEKCMRNKVKRATREPMAITETPQRPFDIVVIDTIGPLTKTHYGNTYAVTIICDLSKYVIAVPVENKEA